MLKHLRSELRAPATEAGDGGGGGAAPTIIARSDDELTKLRHTREALDGFLEEQIARSEEQGKINEALRQSLAESDKRLAWIEDKVNNPKHRFWHADGSGVLRKEERQAAISEWMKINYRQAQDKAFMADPQAAAWRDGQVSTTDSKGGYLIPVPLLPEIIAIMDKYGVARRLLRVVPVGAKRTLVSSLTTKPLVYWPEDSTVPTISEAEFGTTNIDVKLMMALGRISLSLAEDEVVGLSSFLVDTFTRASAKEEDTQAFGNGTSPFTGLQALTGITTAYLGGASNSGTTTWVGKLTYSDFLTTLEGCDPQVVDDGAWLISQAAMFECMNVKDDQGRPLWIPGLASGAERTILGRPYVVSNALPNTAAADKIILAYGDWSYYLMADRRQVTVDFSDIAGYTSASTYVRLLERVGFAMTLKAAFSILRTAAS